ncbi:MAG TPA: 1,4-alpha-glucan branching protein [Thermomonospora sp.]|nr:1,4-alpha-glucan branching protein [Thermomonospora sp.]
MAVIHRTTMTPSKLELLTAWLPTQPWYAGGGEAPELVKAGGFRLDDPEGEVGIEFMVVTDTSRGRPVTYQVPLTYRGAPLAGADHALIGTSEHGVLGRRWIYDGPHDPVLAAQLFALIAGKAVPQAQSESGTPDPTVVGHLAENGPAGAADLTGVSNGPDGTDLLMEAMQRRLTIRIQRRLGPRTADSALGHVTAEWLLPDGAKARGLFAVMNEER